MLHATTTAAREERSENKREEQPCRHKGQCLKKLQQEVLQALGEIFLCSPWADHGEAAVALQLREIH